MTRLDEQLAALVPSEDGPSAVRLVRRAKARRAVRWLVVVALTGVLAWGGTLLALDWSRWGYYDPVTLTEVQVRAQCRAENADSVKPMEGGELVSGSVVIVTKGDTTEICMLGTDAPADPHATYDAADPLASCGRVLGYSRFAGWTYLAPAATFDGLLTESQIVLLISRNGWYATCFFSPDQSYGQVQETHRPRYADLGAVFVAFTGKGSADPCLVAGFGPLLDDNRRLLDGARELVVKVGASEIARMPVQHGFVFDQRQVALDDAMADGGQFQVTVEAIDGWGRILYTTHRELSR